MFAVVASCAALCKVNIQWLAEIHVSEQFH